MVGLSGCIKQESPTAPLKGGIVEVLGRVVDFNTGAGVGNTPVSFGAYGVTTDQFGFYRMYIPGNDYVVLADREIAASQLRVIDPQYRGDLFVRSGACTARYGKATDIFTRRGIGGVTVALAGTTATTDASGWYTLSLGCTPGGFGVGTVLITATHGGYADWSRAAGRREGLRGLERIDIDLEPR